MTFPTIDEELRTDYFEKLLTENGFEKATKIRYDGYTIIDCSKTTSNAFSLPCFNLFYDYNDEFIKIFGFQLLLLLQMTISIKY